MGGEPCKRPCAKSSPSRRSRAPLALVRKPQQPALPGRHAEGRGPVHVPAGRRALLAAVLRLALGAPGGRPLAPRARPCAVQGEVRGKGWNDQRAGSSDRYVSTRLENAVRRCRGHPWGRPEAPAAAPISVVGGGGGLQWPWLASLVDPWACRCPRSTPGTRQTDWAGSEQASHRISLPTYVGAAAPGGLCSCASSVALPLVYLTVSNPWLPRRGPVRVSWGTPMDEFGVGDAAARVAARRLGCNGRPPRLRGRIRASNQSSGPGAPWWEQEGPTGVVGAGSGGPGCRAEESSRLRRDASELLGG